MTARAVLVEDTLPFVLMDRVVRCPFLFPARFCGRFLRYLRRCLGLRHRLERQERCRQDEKTGEEMFQAHFDFPFQAGKRNRYTMPVSQMLRSPVEENCRA